MPKPRLGDTSGVASGRCPNADPTPMLHISSSLVEPQAAMHVADDQLKEFRVWWQRPIPDRNSLRQSRSGEDVDELHPARQARIRDVDETDAASAEGAVEHLVMDLQVDAVGRPAVEGIDGADQRRGRE